MATPDLSTETWGSNPALSVECYMPSDCPTVFVEGFVYYQWFNVNGNYEMTGQQYNNRPVFKNTVADIYLHFRIVWGFGQNVDGKFYNHLGYDASLHPVDVITKDQFTKATADAKLSCAITTTVTTVTETTVTTTSRPPTTHDHQTWRHRVFSCSL